jgi:hypothetical protein
MFVAQGRWELSDTQDAGSYRSSETRLAHENLARTFVRATETNLKPEHVTRDAHGLEKIRIVRDHERDLAIAAERIEQEMARKVDV